MKFLIIRFSSIGDIVLTSPVIRCLKEQVVTSEIHFLTKKNFASIFTANPYIDKMHYLEDDLSSTITNLRNEDFDYVIDLHHNVRTLKVKNGLKIVFTIVSETVMQGTFWGDYYDEGNPFGNNKPIHISNGSFYLKVQK